MNDFQGIPRFRFHEGKLEEFKHLSAQCMEIVDHVIGRLAATVSLSGPFVATRVATRAVSAGT